MKGTASLYSRSMTTKQGMMKIGPDPWHGGKGHYSVHILFTQARRPLVFMKYELLRQNKSQQQHRGL